MKNLTIPFMLLFTVTSLFSNSNSESKKVKVNLTGVQNLELITSSGDIEIITEYRDDIYIDFKSYNNGPQLFIDRGKTLKIVVKQVGFKIFTFNRGNVKLKVIIPKKYDENLNAHSSSGDIYISDLKLKDLNIKLSSGDLTAENLVINNGKLNASSGDMELNNIGIEKLKVSLSSGKLELNGFIGEIIGELSSGSADITLKELTGNIDFRLSSGDFRMTLNENEVNAKLNLRTSSGDIEVGFPVLVTKSKNNRAFIGTSGNGKYNITVLNSSGDIDIK